MRDYEMQEFMIPDERYVLFIINTASYFPTWKIRVDQRDRAVREMTTWCEEQFGPKIDNPRADFNSGWYVPDNDTVFSFSDDRLEWATAFKMRWA